MRRKSVWKQRTIAYLAAVSLAVGMIPASLPAADAYAEETDVAETAVLEVDVQQTDEQEAVSGQEANEQEADVKEAEQEAEEQETQPEAEESDDFIIAPEQAVQTVEWYDWLYVDSEKITNKQTESYPETDPYGTPVEKPKIKKYNTSQYIENFSSTIYDVTPDWGVGGAPDETRPTVLFGTFETEKGKNYRFSFDYLVRWWRATGIWTLEDPGDDRINTFDVYVYSGELEVKQRAVPETAANGVDENIKLQNELNEVLNKSNCVKMGTYMGQYQDWSHDVFSFEAAGNKTTIIFKPKRNHNCGALVTNMKLEETGNNKLTNQSKANDPNNLLNNGGCDANKSGWGSVSYSGEGNDGTGIKLDKGVSQDLTRPLKDGDKIEYAFDIKGTSAVDGADEVEVWLYGGDEPVKLTTVEPKDGEWQTVSGFYNIEGDPKDYRIELKPKNPSADNAPVIDNVSVMLTNNAPKDDVEQQRKDAIDAITKMENLPPEQKTEYTNKIKNEDDPNKIIDELKKAAEEELEAKADKAKEDIGGLPKLGEDKKTDYKDDVDDAKIDAKDEVNKPTTNTVDKILEEVKKGNDEIDKAVEEAKKAADKKDGKDKIDDMDNLSDPEKNKYKDEIDKADSDEKINEIIKDASKKDIDNQAKDVKDKIDKNDVLTDDDKDDLKKEVDKAATDAKNNISAAKNPDEIKKAADDGKAKINAVANKVNKVNSLTDAEKELWKNSQPLESVENSILTTNTDKKDSKGSCFSKLRLKGIGQNKKIKLKWKKQSGADGYIIYGSACGKNIKMKKVKDIPNGKKTTWTQKKLKKGTYYKYKVVAYKTIAGQKRVIAQSISVHATTDGGKKGNPTKAIVKSKKNITLKKGKKTKIKATYGKNKPVAEHIRIVRFESAKPEIATVNKKGQVKAKKPGKCTIFVYTQNGYFTTVKVTVKK